MKELHKRRPIDTSAISKRKAVFMGTNAWANLSSPSHAQHVQWRLGLLERMHGTLGRDFEYRTTALPHNSASV